MGKMITRRHLLIGAGALAALPFVGFGLAKLACAPDKMALRDVRRLLAELGDPDQARALGRIYLATQATTWDGARIAAHLLGKARLSLAARSDCPATRAHAVSLQCVDDFKDDRVVTIDGWVFSDTEAHLFALAALSEPDSIA